MLIRQTPKIFGKTRYNSQSLVPSRIARSKSNFSKLSTSQSTMASSPPDFKLSSTQTALALIVPSHLQPEINAIRKIHDKAYRKWEPHINILYPFVDTSLLSSAITTLHAHLSE